MIEARNTMSAYFLMSILIIVFAFTNHVNSVENLQNAPVPGSPEADHTTKPLKLLNNFVPASMHVLQHCIESIQYEPTVTQPMTTTTIKPITTTATVTAKPTTFHKPGYFGPEKPPSTPFPASISTSANVATFAETTTETGEALLWNDKQFFEWFLQNKYKKIKFENEYSLQLLDPLPLRLLQDIENERYELTALLDKDNVNEFRKVYDDNYRRNELGVFLSTSSTENKPHQVNDRSPGSRKRVPPTKPYIHMLMLYDLLKREAKKYMFNLYEGYSTEILAELASANPENGQQQLLFVLTRMLQEKNIDKSDVVSRTKAMITELENEHSAISKALIDVIPLKFAQ